MHKCDLIHCLLRCAFGFKIENYKLSILYHPPFGNKSDVETNQNEVIAGAHPTPPQQVSAMSSQLPLAPTSSGPQSESTQLRIHRDKLRM